MDKKQLASLHHALEALIDAPLNAVTRSADALCLSLGAIIPCSGVIRDACGKLVSAEVDRSIFALEISCCYRMTCGNSMILAKNDLYQPAHAIQEQWALEGIEVIPEDFDCEAIDHNRLDERIREFFSDCKGIRVSSVKINPFGDLKLRFSNGFMLTTMSDVSGAEECWRFFRRDTQQHIVVTGSDLDLDEVDSNIS